MLDHSSRSDLLHALHASSNTVYRRVVRPFYGACIAEFVALVLNSSMGLIGFALLFIWGALVLRARGNYLRASHTIEQLYRREDRVAKPWGGS